MRQSLAKRKERPKGKAPVTIQLGIGYGFYLRSTSMFEFETAFMTALKQRRQDMLATSVRNILQDTDAADISGLDIKTFERT